MSCSSKLNEVASGRIKVGCVTQKQQAYFILVCAIGSSTTEPSGRCLPGFHRQAGERRQYLRIKFYLLPTVQTTSLLKVNQLHKIITLHNNHNTMLCYDSVVL